MNNILKIKIGMETNKPELNLYLDTYSNYNIILGGVHYQIDKEKLKKLLKVQLPTTFIEVEEGYQPIKYSMKLCTLSKLLYLRDIYRQGWTPNWNDGGTKYTVLNDGGELSKSIKSYNNRIFSFQSAEIRDKFYNNFKDMLEEVKDLI